MHPLPAENKAKDNSGRLVDWRRPRRRPRVRGRHDGGGRARLGRGWWAGWLARCRCSCTARRSLATGLLELFVPSALSTRPPIRLLGAEREHLAEKRPLLLGGGRPSICLGETGCHVVVCRGGHTEIGGWQKVAELVKRIGGLVRGIFGANDQEPFARGWIAWSRRWGKFAQRLGVLLRPEIVGPHSPESL